MATPRPQRSLLLILGMIATILLGWVLHVGADIIQPLVIALLLGSMLQPVVGWLAKRHIPPAVTVLLIVSGLFFVLLQVGLIFQSNVRAFLGEAVTAEAPLQETGGAEPTAPEELTPEEGVAEQAPDEAEPTEEDDSPLLEGPLTEIFDRQQEAMVESGGWAGIKAGIRGRIERAAQLPEEMRNYALKVWDEFDPSGLAENLAVSGYGFVKSLVLVLIG